MGCDRRDFLRGTWRSRSDSSQRATILVQVRPDRLDTAERYIRSVVGIEICSRDSRGKLFLAVEPAAVATALCTLGQSADVLATTLVTTSADHVAEAGA
jgi:hypothetical protein